MTKKDEIDIKILKESTRDILSFEKLALIAARHMESIHAEVNTLVEEQVITNMMVMMVQDTTTLNFIRKNLCKRK